MWGEWVLAEQGPPEQRLQQRGCVGSGCLGPDGGGGGRGGWAGTRRLKPQGAPLLWVAPSLYSFVSASFLSWRNPHGARAWPSFPASSPEVLEPPQGPSKTQDRGYSWGDPLALWGPVGRGVGSCAGVGSCGQGGVVWPGACCSGRGLATSVGRGSGWGRQGGPILQEGN